MTYDIRLLVIALVALAGVGHANAIEDDSCRSNASVSVPEDQVQHSSTYSQRRLSRLGSMPFGDNDGAGGDDPPDGNGDEEGGGDDGGNAGGDSCLDGNQGADGE